MKLPGKPPIYTKFLFYSTLVIIGLVILSVWLSGIDSHRSLFQNSIVSTSILAIVFFLFISLSLYNGLKLKDNLGNIVTAERMKKAPGFSGTLDNFDLGLPDVGEGIGGIIISIVLWIIFSFLLAFLLSFLGLFFWSAVLFLAAMLYWIFFRALRLVFKNSGKCKGNILKSFSYGFLYSFLYVSWIYGIILFVKYIDQ
ncbi:hypothetical protein OK18_18330 [Chryseobacterium gallinarum]|uniref:Uncharacterized protein n=1 Tax=Chryseobacterium gallinarum TaxID=1324352 RepID=A0A0G3M6U5_CHRGL|nr:hypothetical protein [Chryseobacterium gallinarum]AKK74300.1 hypothetical protein OK18_18330 [Chryseobacterium gallinarum]